MNLLSNLTSLDLATASLDLKGWKNGANSNMFSGLKSAARDIFASGTDVLLLIFLGILSIAVVVISIKFVIPNKSEKGYASQKDMIISVLLGVGFFAVIYKVLDGVLSIFSSL